MNIADSSCWIEYLMDSDISAPVVPIIENAVELIVPTITIRDYTLTYTKP